MKFKCDRGGVYVYGDRWLFLSGIRKERMELAEWQLWNGVDGQKKDKNYRLSQLVISYPSFDAFVLGVLDGDLAVCRCCWSAFDKRDGVCSCCATKFFEVEIYGF